MTEGIELLNQEKIKILGEKETYKNLGILGSGHHQTSEDRKRIKKRVFLENQETTRNQII